MCEQKEGLLSYRLKGAWPTNICDPTPANEALSGKINFELWAKM